MVYSFLITGKKKGFTLSEVLITIGIVAVVAALTLPSLFANIRDKQTVAKLKKTYSILQNVSTKIIQSNGNLDMWNDDSLGFFEDEVIKNLNVLTYCEKAANCSPGFAYNYPAVILNDGTAIAFKERKLNSSPNSLHICKASLADKTNSVSLHYNFCARVIVDINGSKKPNRLGKDVFHFNFFTDGVLPVGVKWGHVASDNFENCLKNKGNHETCAAWVILNENLDYLYCPEKLDWDGPVTCR